MGNQHFIVLVAGIVVASIATIFAIQMWDEGRTEDTITAITQDLTRMATDARAWKHLPPAYGGQPRSVATGGCAPLDAAGNCAEDDWRGFTSLGWLGYEVDDSGVFSNRNGRYILSRPGGADQAPQIMGYNDLFDVTVVLSIEGTGVDGLPVEVAEGQGVPEVFPKPLIRVNP